jgi:lipopolysaccharide heptosyltransferase I
VTRILIVRLSALGDIIHALPAAAALRQAFPQARLDWVVDARHRAILELVPAIDRRFVISTKPARAGGRDAGQADGVFAGAGGLLRLIGELRRRRYDVALDLQGLLKSAVIARSSGAARVIGFAVGQLRERAARFFYTETHESPGRHVIQKNLSLLAALGVEGAAIEFPLQVPASPIVDLVRDQLGLGRDGRFALVNAGAAWPNKRWPPALFGEVAAALGARHGLRSVVLWGPGEEALAAEVVSASQGAAVASPGTTIAELVSLSAAAALMVSGDTGPLHIAAAVGTPLVGIFGPTNPERNGPFAAGDISVSRFSMCTCHHRRRCTAARWCLLDVPAQEVVDAVDRRLAAVAARG